MTDRQDVFSRRNVLSIKYTILDTVCRYETRQYGRTVTAYLSTSRSLDVFRINLTALCLAFTKMNEVFV